MRTPLTASADHPTDTSRETCPATPASDNEGTSDDIPASPAGRPDVHVTSWRMVTQSVNGAPATSDATLRVQVGDRVVMGTGDGTTPAEAYAAAEAVVLDIVDPADADVHAVRIRLHAALAVDHACVYVDAVHAEGLMGRLAALVTPFPVTAFAYHRAADGEHARAALCLDATPWQVERVSNKLRRVIGVLNVRTDPDHRAR